MFIDHYGWIAHFEYKMEEDLIHVFLVKTDGTGRRASAVSIENGALSVRQREPDEITGPLLRIPGSELAGIVMALSDALERTSMKDNEREKLRAELAGVKGTLDYSKSITDRLLNHVLARPAADS